MTIKLNDNSETYYINYRKFEESILRCVWSVLDALVHFECEINKSFKSMYIYFHDNVAI